VITKDASGNFTLFLDGVSDGTGVDAATLGSDPAIPLTLGAWIGDGLQYSVSDISFLHLLAIQFSAEDAFRFHVTPYAMLEPVVRRRYFVPAAAGGVTYPQLERGIRGLERGVAIGSFR